MNSYFSIFLLSLLKSTLVEANPVQCTGVRERKAWAKLTDEDQQKFLQAVIALKSHDGNNGVPSYDTFVKVHDVNTFDAHFIGQGPIDEYSQFLTWHRWFLYRFESALQSISGDCTIALPFWEYETNARNIEDSAVFGKDSFGTVDGVVGTEGPETKYFVTEGIAACTNPWWKSTVATGSCLERTFGRGQNFNAKLIKDQLVRFTSQAGLLNIITSFEVFRDFHLPLEGTPHTVPHEWVGGNVANIFISPDDPLFYMLHGNVDRIWSLWEDYRDVDLVATEDMGEDQFSGVFIDVSMPFDSRDGIEEYFYLDGKYPTPRDVLLNNDAVQVKYVEDSLATALKNALASDNDPSTAYTPNPEWFTLSDEGCFDYKDSCSSDADCCSNDCTGGTCKRDDRMMRGVKGNGPPLWAEAGAQEIWEEIKASGMPAKAAIHELARRECGPNNLIQVSDEMRKMLGDFPEKYLRCIVE